MTLTTYLRRPLDIQMLTCVSLDYLSYLIKIFVWRNFRHQAINSSPLLDEKFHPIKVKVSLVEVQVEGKKSFRQIVIILLGETL